MTNVIDRSSPRGLARWARRVSVLAAVLGLLAVLAMLLSGPSYRLGLLGLRAAFGLMGLGAKGGIAAAVLALIALPLALLSRSVRPSLLAVSGLLLGVLAFGPPALFARKAGEVPPIHDISTDTATPPQFQALLTQRAGAPNTAVYGGPVVAAQQRAAYPDIRPLQWKASPTKVFTAALATAQAMGWTIGAQQPSEGRIEATATTFWFGFKDDVVIRLRPDDGGTRLDIRSESRVGSSDVGANAERIRSFREKLQERLANDHA